MIGGSPANTTLRAARFAMAARVCRVALAQIKIDLRLAVEHVDACTEQVPIVQRLDQSLRRFLPRKRVAGIDPYKG